MKWIALAWAVLVAAEAAHSLVYGPGKRLVEDRPSYRFAALIFFALGCVGVSVIWAAR